MSNHRAVVKVTVYPDGPGRQSSYTTPTPTSRVVAEGQRAEEPRPLREPQSSSHTPFGGSPHGASPEDKFSSSNPSDSDSGQDGGSQASGSDASERQALSPKVAADSHINHDYRPRTPVRHHNHDAQFLSEAAHLVSPRRETPTRRAFENEQRMAIAFAKVELEHLESVAELLASTLTIPVQNENRHWIATVYPHLRAVAASVHAHTDSKTRMILETYDILRKGHDDVRDEYFEQLQIHLQAKRKLIEIMEERAVLAEC
ncbi:hypothetical protein MKZ38_002675 [Zalerion maritima]|uniref:Uncharacterized protein n=1 Tax=Zalerion maritima TaxID=339359 RepID=A0AAD5WSW1_9PEZI|nr:hypothetical protein MKZ38_002675 [Zalerion maritima]